MKNQITIYLLLLSLTALQSCKLDNKNNPEINNKKTQIPKLSLSQMETQNGKLIDSVEKRVLNQIKQRDFVSMFREADSSLVKSIGTSDINDYFNMIDRFYGQLDTLKMYGTTATEEGKSIDYIANFSSGDSLELNYKLRFYNHDVKLSYITMNRFQKNPIPESVFKIFKPKIDNIFNRNIELVYNDCTKLFKSKITIERISNLLDKNLKSDNNKYELIDCKPLMFGKGEVGFVAKTQKKMKNGLTKKVNIIFFLDDAKKFKIADIQINK